MQSERMRQETTTPVPDNLTAKARGLRGKKYFPTGRSPDTEGRPSYFFQIKQSEEIRNTHVLVCRVASPPASEERTAAIPLLHYKQTKHNFINKKKLVLQLLTSSIFLISIAIFLINVLRYCCRHFMRHFFVLRKNNKYITSI